MSSRRHLKSAGSLPGIVWQDTFLRDGAFLGSYPDIGVGSWVFDTQDGDQFLETSSTPFPAFNMQGELIELDGIIRTDRDLSVLGAPYTQYSIPNTLDMSKNWEARFDAVAMLDGGLPTVGTYSLWYPIYLGASNNLRLQNHPSPLGAGNRRLIIISTKGGSQDRFDYDFAVPDVTDSEISIPITAVYNGSTVAIYVNGNLAYIIIDPYIPVPSTNFNIVYAAGTVTNIGSHLPHVKPVGASRLAIFQ